MNDQQTTNEAACGGSALTAELGTACRGANCGCTDGLNHSQECFAEHESTISLYADAARYRWLRAQNWNDNTIAAVRWPKDAIKLGHDSPSGDRLDDLIDAAMLGPNA